MFKDNTKVGDHAELTVTRKPPEQIDAITNGDYDELKRRRAQVPSTWYCIKANRVEADTVMWIYNLPPRGWLKVVYHSPNTGHGALVIMGKITSVDPLRSSVVFDPDTVLLDSQIDNARTGNGGLSLHNCMIEQVFCDDEQLAKKIRGLREQETNK